MGKIDEIEERLESLETKPVKKKKGFKLPWKVNSMVKKTEKKADYIFVMYLTIKGTIEFRSEKIVSGNIVVIRNKAYEINPRRSYRYGKNLWYIIQEHNRYPISNENYDEIKAKGQDTDADVPLIKAVFAAWQKQQQSPLGGKSIWIWIILGVAAIGAIYFFMSK